MKFKKLLLTTGSIAMATTPVKKIMRPTRPKPPQPPCQSNQLFQTPHMISQETLPMLCYEAMACLVTLSKDGAIQMPDLEHF